MLFANKTVFITGASRGIGKAIALKLAKDGANIIIAAKSVEEDARLGGTIYTAAKEMEEAGGKALAVPCDIRNEEQVLHAIQRGVAFFGGIDILVNNASAISLTNTEHTEAKKMDLMYEVNVKGTFTVTKHCIPFLRKSANPHILTISPPVNLHPKWFARHAAYTLSKYNMSMLSMSWAEEYKGDGIASNTLWPATLINTAAVRNMTGGEKLVQHSRKPDIMADAAHHILQQPSRTTTGNFFIDEKLLAEAGITDMDVYSAYPGSQLQKDLFLD